MIRAIAIDDEPEALDIISFHASKLNNLELVKKFYHPETAIQYLKNNPIDLLFLDVNMPNISGIDLLKTLKLKPMVIFTTAYEQYAVESYKLEAIDYLLKPIDFDSFRIAVNKAKKAISTQELETKEDYVFIKDGTKTIRLFYNQILYLKGCGNYVEFITTVGKYSSRMTITQLLTKLPETIFSRIHNSFIVNIEKIEKIEYNHIIIDEHKISIGESHRDSFNDLIKKRLI